MAGDGRHSPIMRGYGESILMQGGFLLIFDGLMYRAEKSNGSRLRGFLEKHPISFDGHRVGTVITTLAGFTALRVTIMFIISSIRSYNYIWVCVRSNQ